MSTTLYRKYRPQTWSEVIAQNHVKVTLINEITSGKLAHAYLFSGPRGIGKTTIARIFAKALNCQNRAASSAEPCGACASCLEITEGRSLDLVEIDAASNRGINEIRELKEQTKYTPVKSKYKIFIIDEVHMLTAEAFNALLKTLEEPPAYAVFILATTEIHKIPETIISRCQRFDFKKVPFSDIVIHLDRLVLAEGIRVDKKVLENVARISEGYLRDALSLLGQILTLGEKEISEAAASLVLPRSDWQKVLEFISCLFNRQTKQALSLLGELAEGGADLEHFSSLVLETVRKILLAKVSGDWQELYWEAGEQEAEIMSRLTKDIKETALVYMIEVLLASGEQVKQARIIQLPLEIAVIKIIEHLGGQAKAEANNPGPKPPASPVAGVSPKDDDPTNNDITSIDSPLLSEVAVAEIVEIALEPETMVGEINLNIEEVKHKWPEVIEALKEHNYSLSAAVKLGQPLQLDGHKVVLGFQYRFHYDRLKEKKNLEKIEDVLLRVYQLKLSIAGEISDNYAGENFIITGQPENSVVKDVLEVLGGEVVG